MDLVFIYTVVYMLCSSNIVNEIYLIFESIFVWCRSFWNQLNQSTDDIGTHDSHAQMTSKYRNIPTWWFVILLLPMIVLSVFVCEGFGNELQLPYWGVILSFLLVLLLIPPFASLRAMVAQVGNSNPNIFFIMLPN